MAADVVQANETVSGPLRGGWRVVAAKEFSDHVRSVRFTVLLVIVGLVAVGTIYGAAGGIRELAENIDQDSVPALFLKLFTFRSEGSRVPSFLTMISLLLPLFGIAFGFDAVNGERSQGTLPRLVSQPIYRDDVINGKFVAGLSVIALATTLVTALVAGVGMFRLGIVPSLPEVTRLLSYLVVSIAYTGFWLALATLFSVVMRRAATSALMVVAIWIAASIFSILLIGIVADIVSPLPEEATPEEVINNAKTERNVSLVFPQRLYEEATFALLQPEVRTFDILGAILLSDPSSQAVPGELTLVQSLLIAWPQVTGLIALTVLCFAVAYVIFMRQEVRA